MALCYKNVKKMKAPIMEGGMSTELRCGALFSGIGGFCFGFEEVGFKTLWAIDIDEHATRAYNLNFKHVEVICEDIIELNNKETKLAPVDILHAGFPCQSFSVAGNRKGFNDPRGELFFEIIRFVKNQSDHKPSIIVLENSPNIMLGQHGAWFDRIRIELQKVGYWFGIENAAVLDARVHGGLPQRRERSFMVAVSRDHFTYNPFLGLEKVKSIDDLAELLEPSNGIDEKYYLPRSNKYGDMIFRVGEKIPKNCIIQLRKNVVRPQKPGVCPTLTANMGMGGHNVPFIIDDDRLRKLTERECLNLQGFPSHFLWPEMPQTSKYRLIGNAVSPRVSFLLAKELHKFYLGD